MLGIEFEELERYIRSSLGTLKTNEAETGHKYRDLKPIMKTGDAEAFSKEEPPQFSGTVPFMLRHSLFITVYSFMEYSLKVFCETAASQMNQHERRVSNFEKVHQYYSFLMNELQLEKQKVEDDWQKLNIFRDLRNSIVHYNSDIGKNISAKTYTFIREDVRIEFNEPRAFRIKDDALILEQIEVSKRFLFTIMDEYHKKYYPLS
jgi:hypothetical protein